MEQFVDRELEIRTLGKEYAKKEASLVVVYGRRRVGKTTLLSEFMKGKSALYFLATQEAETFNRAAFQEKAADFTGNDFWRKSLWTSGTRFLRRLSPPSGRRSRF